MPKQSKAPKIECPMSRKTSGKFGGGMDQCEHCGVMVYVAERDGRHAKHYLPSTGAEARRIVAARAEAAKQAEARMVNVEDLECGERFADFMGVGERIQGGTETAAGKFVAVRFLTGMPAYLPHGFRVQRVVTK